MNHPFKKFGNSTGFLFFLSPGPFGAGSVAEFGFLFFFSSFLPSIEDKSSEREWTGKKRNKRDGAELFVFVWNGSENTHANTTG